MSSTPRLANADLDRLETLLAADHLRDSMTLDALQGLCCAVASAPVPVEQAAWLDAALGEHTFASESEGLEITGLLVRFHNDTARDLAAEEGVEVLSYPPQEGEEELAVWCEGYLAGVALAEADWFGDGDDEETVGELLFPFMALSGRMKEQALESGAPWEEGEAEATLLSDARAIFYDTVEEAFRYGFDRRINRVPQQREGEKVGRNEPCPCGSAKKYKSCHGAG